jgi:hypothetical protein
VLQQFLVAPLQLPDSLLASPEPVYEEQLFRELWEDETQRDVVIDSLKADCEVRAGRPPGL